MFRTVIVRAQLHRALTPIEQDTTFVVNLIDSRRCLSCLRVNSKSSRLFVWESINYPSKDYSYNLPARKTLSIAMLDASYQDLLEKVKNNLTEAKAVALTSDGWTGINNDSFMAATVRYIDEKSGLLKSQLLECGNFTGRHTSENIAKWLTVVQETFNIKSKVVCVVTDNAANMKNAVMLCGVEHIPCFAHSLHLVVKKSINASISDTVERVKKIVDYKRSSIATAKLGELQKNLHHKEQELILDVSTRWNSTLCMLERFNENKEPIISSLALSGVTNPIEENDWVIMTDAASVLKVFHSITRSCRLTCSVEWTNSRNGLIGAMEKVPLKSHRSLEVR